MLFTVLLVVIFCAVIDSVYSFFKRLICGRPRIPVCLIGKTAIVTGGNRGTGFHVCMNLASHGCKVIIADKDVSEQSRTKIINSTGNVNILSKKLDLSSFRYIREFVEDIRRSEKSLHYLIHLAEAGIVPIEATEDGLDPIMQIDCFGPFLLTTLLTEHLWKGAPGRVVFPSSFWAQFGGLTKGNFGNFKPYDSRFGPFHAYNNAQLSITLAAKGFAKKFTEDGELRCTFFQRYRGNEQFEQFIGKLSLHRYWHRRIHIIDSIVDWVKNQEMLETADSVTFAAISNEPQCSTCKYFCHLEPVAVLFAQNLPERVWIETEKVVRLEASEKIDFQISLLRDTEDEPEETGYLAK